LGDSHSTILRHKAVCVLCTALGQQPNSEALVTDHYFSNSVLLFSRNNPEIYCSPL